MASLKAGQQGRSGKAAPSQPQPLFSASCSAFADLAHQHPFLGLPAPSSPLRWLLSACPGWGEKGAGGRSPRMLRPREGPRASWSCRAGGLQHPWGYTARRGQRKAAPPSRTELGGLPRCVPGHQQLPPFPARRPSRHTRTWVPGRCEDIT